MECSDPHTQVESRVDCWLPHYPCYDEEKNRYVEKLINDNFDLSPRGIREMLDLNKPIYEKTAAYGHFGRDSESDGSFSWEKIDKADVFNK